MFEAKPENVAAIATMATMKAFWREVKMLYGIGGSAGMADEAFSGSDIMTSSLALSLKTF